MEKGSENIVADALSRVKCSAELNSLTLSTITSDLLQKVKDIYDQDSGIPEKIQQLTSGTYKGDKYTWEGVVLKRKGKIVMGNDELLRTTIIKHFHANAPLPIHEKVWSEISTNFIKSQGKSVIFVVVDRLSKYAHFMALTYLYTASSMA
ncbi:hypothetical protein Tco_1431817 [Tanacetum coccineum]